LLVGLQELWIGGARRGRLVDVDVSRAESSHRVAIPIRSVTVVVALVGVGREFQKERVSDALGQREVDVFVAIGADRSCAQVREGAFGNAETGVLRGNRIQIPCGDRQIEWRINDRLPAKAKVGCNGRNSVERSHASIVADGLNGAGIVINRAMVRRKNVGRGGGGCADTGHAMRSISGACDGERLKAVGGSIPSGEVVPQGGDHLANFVASIFRTDPQLGCRRKVHGEGEVGAGLVFDFPVAPGFTVVLDHV
jgi:hypothetical protein